MAASARPSPVSSTFPVADPEYDNLGHEVGAQSIISIIEDMGPGSVIAIQGPWGRGKTDMLRRIFRLSSYQKIFINPWAYGESNLLLPLIESLIAVAPKEADKGAVMAAVRSVLKFGASMGMKLTALVTANSALGVAADPSVDAVEKLFDARSQAGDKFASDPIYELRQQFKKLVDLCAPDGKLLICVDDLDRCMPARQISLIESFHFLSSAEANAVFLLAIDPVLFSDGVRAYYNTNAFDANVYLEKMFDARLNLPQLTPTEAASCLIHFLSADDNCEHFGELRANMSDAITAVMKASTEFRRPRILVRVARKMRLARRSGARLPMEDQSGMIRVFYWLLMSERWPLLRAEHAALYEAQSFADLITFVVSDVSAGHPIRTDTDLVNALRYVYEMASIPNPNKGQTHWGSLQKLAKAISATEVTLERCCL